MRGRRRKTTSTPASTKEKGNRGRLGRVGTSERKAELLTATFSIVARDRETQALGIAVASKFLAVGALVPYARSGVGAIATQSFINTSFGPLGLQMFAEGRTVEEIKKEFVTRDPRIDLRQFGLVAANGEALSYTGQSCFDWAGGHSEDGLAVQGNLLPSGSVVEEMVSTYRHASDLRFPERLLASLLAGEQAGGDKRGKQAASLLVVAEGRGYGGFNDRWIDLRVDDHERPVPQLRRLLELHRLFLSGRTGETRSLDGPEIKWIQHVLKDNEFLDEIDEPGTWDAQTEAALEALYGWENLEERWIPGGVVDPVAWEYLQARYEA